MKTFTDLLTEKNELLTRIKQSEDPATDQTVDEINDYLDHVLEFLREITPTK